jgi:hypothetical protein
MGYIKGETTLFYPGFAQFTLHLPSSIPDLLNSLCT